MQSFIELTKDYRLTLRVCVLQSICQSDILSRNSSYIFCQINFKFCTLFFMIYEDVHVVLNFVLAIVWWSYGPI